MKPELDQQEEKTVRELLSFLITQMEKNIENHNELLKWCLKLQEKVDDTRKGSVIMCLGLLAGIIILSLGR